ncbi:hypothetical protein [Novosphingobium sp. JCM 18896]|uniref:hypothetical protein n=1 Tax=Novosphingobium sp. JCM 18896 TaxID=2989731 RepID=UPI002223446D|nr:hypothetical protein [Novosphingobium sp. JCM 18896]MCW1431405.1 hypothetical protein [Novosphingobium sp. JCM 18896]
MPIDLTQKLVPTVGLIQIKAQDGSPLVDDAGQPAFARVHSPASKVWEVANAARRRKSMKRVRENGGKIEAAADAPEDVIEFLCAVTEEFINVSVPLAEGETGAKAMVKAIYSHPQLGYIRDQMDGDSRDWAAFTSGSTSN